MGHAFQYATPSIPNSSLQYPNLPPLHHTTRPLIQDHWRRCCVRPSGGLRPAPPLLLPVPTTLASTQPTHTSTRWRTADAGVSRGPAAQYFSVTPGEGGQVGHPLLQDPPYIRSLQSVSPSSRSSSHETRTPVASYSHWPEVECGQEDDRAQSGGLGPLQPVFLSSSQV